LRALDQNGQGAESQVIAAIQTAIQLKKYNIRVINLSLGRPVYESYTLDPLCQAVEQAWKAGIVVVVAAGNEGRNNSANTNGYGSITAPGNDPYVITVGANEYQKYAQSRR
jgi:serine protease AprX